MIKWKVISVEVGTEGEYLEQGWEPFAVSAHDTSYDFYNSTLDTMAVEHQTTDFIYLRQKRGIVEILGK